MGRRLPRPEAWPATSGSSVTRPGLLLEPEDQGHGKRAGREGDDDAGDHHRLRHGIEREAGRRSPARDDAEHQEDAAADQIEGENLAKRLRIDDEAVEPEPDQRRPDQSRQRRRAHGSGLRRGGPATSIGRVDRDRQHHESLDERG